MDYSSYPHNIGSALKFALEEEIERRANLKNKQNKQNSDEYVMRMIIASIKESEAKHQKILEDIIRDKDAEIERLRNICEILKSTNRELARNA
jgi:bacterioferritin (cytochrome b1)